MLICIKSSKPFQQEGMTPITRVAPLIQQKTIASNASTKNLQFVLNIEFCMLTVTLHLLQSLYPEINQNKV